jgi:hypothetical protein
LAIQFTKTALKYQMTTKYTKVFHRRPFKNAQIGIFCMKIYRLATLLHTETIITRIINLIIKCVHLIASPKKKIIHICTYILVDIAATFEQHMVEIELLQLTF